MKTTLKECVQNGTHLQSCDDDGFCNVCGHQEQAYKVVYAFGDGSENGEAMNLVNINDEYDVHMCAEDQFTVGEIVTENQITFKQASYVDDVGLGTADFAFKLNEYYGDYGISTSDGHDEDWVYCATEAEARKIFEESKECGDVHLYEYNIDYGYEVIDSFCFDDYEIDDENNCIYCGAQCFLGEMCDEQQAGGIE